MIKSVVVSLVALSVAFVPVAAEARNRDGYRGGNHSEQREHKRSRISTGEAIAIGFGAFILGAAASSNRRNDRATDREVYDQEVYGREYGYHYRRQNCREVFTSGIDRYGDYYEKRITRCN
jgi:cytochrome c oxidase assembly protein Cox11